MRFVDFEPGGDVHGCVSRGHPEGMRFTAAYNDQPYAMAGWRVIATTVALRTSHVDDLTVAAVLAVPGWQS